MKTIRSALAYVLLLAMLLSSVGGFAYGAGENIVSVGEQMVFNPLAGTQSVAYERHTDGYEVTLDRAADGVTMRVTAVPETVSAEGAALYIRTGVAPEAGKTYRVSYTLASEKALDEYAVCFDGTEENAYGTAEKRSVAAGGADLARCFLTPAADSGELVLRLLLGKTEVNTLRFSELAVEEAAEEEIAAGANTVLVDDLDYNAPGFIRFWTNDDCGATLTSDGSSSTLTVTEVPRSGAEVWKIKLLVATGLMPEAGKAYRFRADVTSSASRKYEVCYNEGETEKGYDVLYNQYLSSGKQTLERTVYVTRDKENPGELIVQLSLGLLQVGDKVTISNVRLEEASATYKDVLPKDFAYDKTEKSDRRTYSTGVLSTGNTNIANISWANSAAVTRSGDKAGELTVDRANGTAALEIKHGSDPWDARFNFNTGVALDADSVYRASVTVKSLNTAYSNLEVIFGSAFSNDFDIKDDYGALKGQQLAAGEAKTFSRTFRTSGEGSGLLIQLFAGATGGQDNTVEVSDITVKKLEEDGGDSTPVAITVDYPAIPSYGTFEMRDNKGELTGNGSSATYKCTTESGGGFWERGLFINDVCTLNAGSAYRISFDVEADKGTNFEVAYNKDGNWGDSEKGFGAEYGKHVDADEVVTLTHELTPEAGGALSIRIDLGNAELDTTVTISNVKVTKYVDTDSAESIGTVTYPESVDSGSFELRDGMGRLSGDGSSVTFACTTASSGEYWERGLFANNVFDLVGGNDYRISFNIEADKDTDFEVAFNKDENWGDGKEKGFGALYGQHVDANTPATITHCAAGGGMLHIRIDLGKAEPDTSVTVSDIKVERITHCGSFSPQNITVTYPDAESNYGSFEMRDSVGELSGDGEAAAEYTCTTDTTEYYQRGLFINDICDLDANESYNISFDIEADKAADFEVAYNKDGNWGDGHEKGFGAEYGKHMDASEAVTVTHAVTPEEGGKLSIRIDLGKAETGTIVTVSNVVVEKGEDSYNDESVGVTYPNGESTDGSFAVRDYLGGLNGDGASAVFIRDNNQLYPEDGWRRALFINGICTLNASSEYKISFDIKADKNTSFDVCYNKDGNWGDGHEKGFGALYSQAATAEASTVEYTLTPEEGGALSIRIDLGSAEGGTRVTVENVKVEKITHGGGYAPETIDVTYPAFPPNSFEVRDGNGNLSGDGASAVFACTTEAGEAWQRGLFVNGICTLNEGKGYKVSFAIKADHNTTYDVCYNKDGNWGASEKGFGAQYGLSATGEWSTAEYLIFPSSDGELSLRIDLGLAETGTIVEVKDFKVDQISFTETGSPIATFGSVWTEQNGCDVTLANSAASATVTLTPGDGVEKADWRAKLLIDTGVVTEADKGYRVSFDIQGEKALSKFHVIYGYGGSGEHEKVYGERWNDSLAAGEIKTITQDVYTNNEPGHPLTVLLLLGLVDGDDNTLTVSNVKVYENAIGLVPSGGSMGYTGTVDVDTQEGYTIHVIRNQDSGSASIERTPDTGAEPWKLKMFVDTGVEASADQWYRVCMDVTAKQDMDYEVCYNRGDTEKGFDALYNLHAAGGKTQTVEKVFCAKGSGKLKLQLSLGTVPAPNTVTVSNVRVEQVSFKYSGQSAMPAEPVYGAQGDVTYWAHNDYTVAPDGSDDAVTMNILKAPSFGAEPWKIKLFLDTATPLEPGKFYRVTTDLLAKSPQNVEICYNSGGVEMGYDSMGGIRLAAGVKQTVEKLIAVPTDKTDGKNLMLQVNLGAATSPNEITVSGVTVEEVSLRYADLMPQSFSYQKQSTVRTSPDIDAKLETTTDTASICITDAPATGAEVWMAQLLVRTGVVLTAGKSYVVRANLVSDKDLTYELCFNNEETEKGFDVLYGQFAHANTAETIDKKISVPAGMTDAGELVLQFSVGGPGANNVTVANVSVQELRYGTNGAKDLTPAAAVEQQGALDLHVSREAVTGRVNGRDGAIRVTGAALCAGEQYEAAFTGKADAALSGTLTLRRAGAAEPVMTQRFELSGEAKPFVFTTDRPLDEGGAYELLWQLEGSGTAELSDITLSIPAEELIVKHVDQKVTVNGAEAAPDVYEINGESYFRLRDLAMLLNDTLAQFVVRYNSQNQTVSVTTGKRYSPVGGELERGADRSASCARGTRSLLVDGKAVSLKAYNLGSNNYFRLADLDDTLGFRTDYIEATDIVAIASPLTPEAQEASYAYGTFFRPEIDSESQPYVGDPMAYYEDGVYYIYYLKEGGDSVNHSVYLTTTSDFASYTEIDKPVLAASRGDAQDSWIGTGSVTKVDGTYYFFYTGYNSSGAREYHEKIMVAKGSSPTSFEKVSGWEITPPASLGQKNDFRDPQAYYDPATGTISLTVTASQGGVARILKYTLNKDLTNAQYDGIIFTDPSGKYWNLECSDTFRLGDKWYLTYSGQEDTLWYAAAESQFGPYSAPVQLDGKVFYAAKHVEDGKNSYMVGWARRSESASSTQEVAAWGGNLAVQKLTQRADGSLALVPVDNVAASFNKPMEVTAESVSLTADSDYSFKQVCTSAESFMLTGEFTYSGTGSFGLAFDFNGKETSYKLISVNPKERTLSLAFNEGVTKIAETPAELGTKHSFTYIQDGSVGIFYVDGVASLTVRVYGSTGKPVYLFAQDNSVSFTSLRCFAR